jgi:hypothetical protein
VEYRAPLFLPARGFRMLPVFFDKLSFSAFADAGSAWCPASESEMPICRNTPTKPDWIASAGGEINLDAAMPYDVPYRFRLGVAAPFETASVAGVDRATVYFTLGLSF